VDATVQLLLSTCLGPVFPLHGIRELPDGSLVCDCRDGKACPSPGKHPVHRGWQYEATADPVRIDLLVAKYPKANWGVATGRWSFMLDIDVRWRPRGNGTGWGESMNGFATLEELAREYRLPELETISVASGRGNGSMHQYYGMPSCEIIRNRVKLLSGLDIRGVGGVAVIPPSRHVSGGYYKFLRSPLTTQLQECPAYLLAAITAPKNTETKAKDTQTPKELLAGFTTGKPRGRNEVLSNLYRDKVAKPLMHGIRNQYHGATDPSRDDFALACKLAFYTRHNLAQSLEIFLSSPLRRRKYTDHYIHGVNYATWTLLRAFQNPAEWERQPRGMALSDTTQKVLHHLGLGLTPATISRILGIPLNTVVKTRSRHFARKNS